ncbi:AraC family transcriptional regulator [Lederbergia lenta]|uniref:AraC family transcriptional regulator n=1 Tax=Lederbergia lenta TaxID=1467 RepID=A0A2X4VXN0_LEDLE|nr:AraC family transcriptional regulator [Lederbergia lenta]MCM3111233.1 AraC family transcriptional regulator [Lederbergia lenta]MEC2325379.1 AraC family transcriptional regulator [Lederbergia lenta]SQI55563.1 AraC family transcriptional regulator [Lederbergia lenta]
MIATKYQSSEYMDTDEFPFWIRRFYHDASNVPPAHSHEFIELVFVVQGCAKHIFEGQSYQIKTNDVFIINPGEIHTFQIESGEEFEIINCLFLPSLIQDSLLKELGVSRSMDYFYIHPFLNKSERFHHLINLGEGYSSRFYSLLEGMMYEYNKENACYSTLIRLQLVELLIILSRIYNEKKSNIHHPFSRESENQLLVQRINGYLTRNYDQKISIPTLCHLFNISPRHLNRIFKQEMGRTVVEVLHSIRIKKAKQFLLESNDKVINVAIKVGYDDPAFFSRLFRRMVGCSPGKYKENTYSSVN